MMHSKATLSILALTAVAPLTAAAPQGETPAQEAPNVPNPPASPDLPTRAVLEDVPRIGYDIHLCPFPGSLCACLQYLGDQCDYDYLMGVTGAAFRRLWERDDGGNVDLMYLEPEPHRRAFSALGYDFRTVPRTDKAAMIQAVRESIAEGRPVLSFVLVGPPECGLVTGYDRGGEVLIGWSYFQPQRDAYCEVPDWSEKLSGKPSIGLILIGEKQETPPPDRETLISSLKWAIDLARQPRRPGLPNHASGLAAYDAWANGLEVDADYPLDEAKVLETRAMVHCDQCVMLHERRSAAAFLRQMAMAVPDVADPLDTAAALYDEAAGVGGKLWRWGHWADPEVQRALADPELRREMAGYIRAARDKEAQAIEQLEKALAAFGGGAG